MVDCEKFHLYFHCLEFHNPLTNQHLGCFPVFHPQKPHYCNCGDCYFSVTINDNNIKFLNSAYYMPGTGLVL